MRVIAWYDAKLDPPPHEDCGEYWGTNYTSDDVLCVYKDDKGNKKMAVCYHLLDGTWRAHGENFNVIYWTPLPKMPKEEKQETISSFQGTIRKLNAALEEQPDIVRCKDCKNWIAGYITDKDEFIPPECGKYQQMVGHSNDDFCSLAERR